MFSKYFKRKQLVNEIIDDLRFDTTFNEIPELPFTYEIKNHFLFIRRTSEPSIIIYNFEANTFKIPYGDNFNIETSFHYNRLLKHLIMVHADLTRRNLVLEKLKKKQATKLTDKLDR